ncbi:MAG: hypothetical protein H6851_17010 [Geminicoccaceae bacterium]|nr:hypothetical protein [Geminicoccaceae bacterium]MCB9945310.1 hypothetical protein [Geminicoccaceae bacterium]
MTRFFTPAGPDSRQSTLARRISRWGCGRLLRFCWLLAGGRQAVLARSGFPGLDDPADIRFMPDIVTVVTAALTRIAGGDGLRSFIMAWAPAWFDDLVLRLLDGPAHENPHAIAWLQWATGPHGCKPLEALLRTVLRSLDKPLREPDPSAAHGDETLPSGTVDPAERPARRVREPGDEGRRREACLRRRGRRHLVRALMKAIMDRLAAQTAGATTDARMRTRAAWPSRPADRLRIDMDRDPHRPFPQDGFA